MKRKLHYYEFIYRYSFYRIIAENLQQVQAWLVAKGFSKYVAKEYTFFRGIASLDLKAKKAIIDLTVLPASIKFHLLRGIVRDYYKFKEYNCSFSTVSVRKFVKCQMPHAERIFKRYWNLDLFWRNFSYK